MPLEIQELGFAYRLPSLFESFSLSCADRTITMILGPSGCGKTTLLKLIAGLLPAQRGRITLNGEVKYPISFLFQEPRLLPWRTVLENCAIPLETRYSRSEARSRAYCMLEKVGLSSMQGSMPDSLSGGQRQRAALARAFAYPSPLILLDEPFQSQDLPLRIQLMDLTRELLALSPRIALAVTHDPREALYLGDRCLVLGGQPVTVALDLDCGPYDKNASYASPSFAEQEALLFEKLSQPQSSSLISR